LRLPVLAKDTPVEDVQSVVDYVKAVSYLTQASESKQSKEDVNKALNYLSRIETNQLMSQAKEMKSSFRELKVLQVALREVGESRLNAAIDDHKTGGKKLKSAMRQARENLSIAQLSAKNTEQKKRINNALELLAEHEQSNVSNKLFAITLNSFTANGTNNKFLQGKMVTQLLKMTEDEDALEPIRTKGAQVVSARKRKK